MPGDVALCYFVQYCAVMCICHCKAVYTFTSHNSHNHPHMGPKQAFYTFDHNIVHPRQRIPIHTSQLTNHSSFSCNYSTAIHNKNQSISGKVVCPANQQNKAVSAVTVILQQMKETRESQVRCYTHLFADKIYSALYNSASGNQKASLKI